MEERSLLEQILNSRSAPDRPALGYDLRYEGNCPACGTELTITLRHPSGPDPEGAPLPADCCGRPYRLERISPAGWRVDDLDDFD